MKARQQSLHDERWQSRARNEGDSKKLYDVRVAESAHQLTFPYELGRGFSFTQNGVDGFGCGVNTYDHLLNFTVGSTADFSASELDVGESERPQSRMIAKEVFSHDSARFLLYGCGSRGITRFKCRLWRYDTVTSQRRADHQKC